MLLLSQAGLWLHGVKVSGEADQWDKVEDRTCLLGDEALDRAAELLGWAMKDCLRLEEFEAMFPARQRMKTKPIVCYWPR